MVDFLQKLLMIGVVCIVEETDKAMDAGYSRFDGRYWERAR